MPRRLDDRSARLGWLVDGEFEVGKLGPNRKAADATVRSVKALGHVEPVDTALVVGFQMLAEAVDNDPTNSGLWNQYRAAEVAIRGLGASDSDPFNEFLRAALVDTEDSKS